MKTHSLALLFGPTFFRSGNESKDFVEMNFQSKLVNFMILNANELFPLAQN